MNPTKKLQALFIFLAWALCSPVKAQQENVEQWMKERNYHAIELHCRQTLFHTYGTFSNGGVYVIPIDNETAEKVIAPLRLAADAGDGNCQFMLACVLSGNKTIRISDEDGNPNTTAVPTPASYKYLHDEEAQRYFLLYYENTMENAQVSPFGMKREEALKLISNAYPLLIELHRKREMLKNIRKAASEGIKDKAPTFGLG